MKMTIPTSSERNIPLWSFDLTDDVARSVPARIGIHDVNKRDGKGAAEDCRGIACLRQKSDPLFWFNNKSSCNERANQEQLHECPKILEHAAEAQVPKMEEP